MDSVSRFVWKKKIYRDIDRGVPISEFSRKAEKKRQRERMAEVQKIKKRREERVSEKARHEEEMGLLARERARAEFHDWEKKEQQFEFSQSRLRAQIRAREGRMKPIDILSGYRNHNIDIEPYSVFEGLSLEEMEQLRDDIKMCVGSDTDVHYWEALLVLCDWELRKKDLLVVEDRGLHPSVEPDVKYLLQAKTYAQLVRFQTCIHLEMRSGTAKVVEYWEAVLSLLHIFKARAFLKEFHANYLEKNPSNTHKDDDQDEGVQDLSVEVDGSLSPQLLHACDNEDAIDPEEDHSILVKQRSTVLEQQRTIPEVGVAESEVYWWQDKYQPRKPLYFSRVHSGYAWNKYNQTHYDHDNPPPATVLGYKFNIFYPDLVDKSRAPSYVIEKDGDNADTCIIRFHAGPPYEDIAFRIINKDWDYSNKKGYKCTFERGILQLYFNFKRYSYRR